MVLLVVVELVIGLATLITVTEDVDDVTGDDNNIDIGSGDAGIVPGDIVTGDAGVSGEAGGAKASGGHKPTRKIPAKHVERKGRKRISQPEKWKKNLTKKRHNPSQEYVACSSKKVMSSDENRSQLQHRML